jgi:ATP-dependent Lon protease
MSLQNKQYNTRYSSKKENEKYESSDDDYNPYDSDITEMMSDDNIGSDEDFIASEDEEINMNEYRKFLYKIYPSRNLEEKINGFEKMEKAVIKDIENQKGEKEEENMTSDDEEYNSDNIKKILKDSMNFNIVFTIGNKDLENEDNDSDNEENEETENMESEEENEEKEGIDSETEENFKEIINSIKNKEKYPNEALEKMENYLIKEKKKQKEQLKKEESKIKKKNTNILKRLLVEKNKMNDLKYFNSLTLTEQESILNEIKRINEHSVLNKPYRISLIESHIPPEYKSFALKKINNLRNMDPGSGEYYKIKQWIDTFMSIPFGKYSKLPVQLNDGILKCQSFMNEAKETLDKAVYGMNDAKLQILQMMGQLISNPESVGTAIALKGPPGTGKTSIVKEGISKILGRPFAFIALGGATDSSYLEGHSYTYEGSVWGKIVDILIKSKTMNPVIYFDELDKISDTAKGEEIVGLLTHLTDTTQNSSFHDKYFSELEFDLSKAIFIFSYNNESKVNPILKDRMYRINTDGYNTKDKKHIATDYLIPKIEENINFNKGEIIIENKALEYIINEFTEKEKGVRNLKRCLEIIFTKLNLYRLMNNTEKLFNKEEILNVEYPFIVNENIVDKLLKKNEEDKWYRHIYT